MSILIIFGISNKIYYTYTHTKYTLENILAYVNPPLTGIRRVFIVGPEGSNEL